MSKLHLTIAAFSALLLLSTAPNDDNLGRLLDHFFATANPDSLFDSLSVLPDEELYLVRWLNDLISDRNLSEFGYWPDLVSSDFYPDFINLTETSSHVDDISTPSFSPLTVHSTDYTPPYSPFSINNTPPVSNISLNVNFTTFDDLLNLTDYDAHNTSTSPLLRDADICNFLTWLKFINHDAPISYYANNMSLPRDSDIFNALIWLN